MAATVLLVEYLAVPQLVRATSDLSLLADATPALLALGVALEVGSLLCYTALTRTVLPARLRTRYVDQLRIDLTSLGFSHVAPGGGAAAGALRVRLMTRAGVPVVDAVSTAAVEAALVLIGLVATFTGGVLLTGAGIRTHPGYGLAGVAAMGLLAAAVWGMRSIGVRGGTPYALADPRDEPPGARARVRRLTQWAQMVLSSARTTAVATAQRARVVLREPRGRAAVLGWAAGNWLLDAACLWVSLRAYGVALPPAALLMGYGAANLLGLLPLTPGGIGVVEGFLVPALVGLGGAALAPVTLGVLTWRLMEYWLPIPVSGATWLSLRAWPGGAGVTRPGGGTAAERAG